MITYNHENYIKQAVEGILMQICDFHIELIIADDKSSDNTGMIIDEIVKNHHNGNWIKYTKHSQNLGMMSNFIWALSQTKGNYIALCEGDDYWTDPLKLQKQVVFLEENPNFTFSMGIVDMYVEKTGKTVVSKEHVNPSKNETYILRDYLKAPFSQTSSFMFRNGGHPFPDWFQNVHAGDQSLVVLKTGLHGRIKYHNELFSVYRVNEKSVSHTVSYNVYVKFLDTLKIWQSHLGHQYNLIFKIINFKYEQYIRLNKCTNILCKIYYTIKIRIVELVLKFV